MEIQQDFRSFYEHSECFKKISKLNLKPYKNFRLFCNMSCKYYKLLRKTIIENSKCIRSFE